MISLWLIHLQVFTETYSSINHLFKKEKAFIDYVFSDPSLGSGDTAVNKVNIVPALREFISGKD